MFHRRCSLIWNCLTYSTNILVIQLSLHRPSILNILSYYDYNIMMSLSTCGVYWQGKSILSGCCDRMMTVMMMMILKQYCRHLFFSSLYSYKIDFQGVSCILTVVLVYFHFSFRNTKGFTKSQAKLFKRFCACSDVHWVKLGCFDFAVWWSRYWLIVLLKYWSSGWKCFCFIDSLSQSFLGLFHWMTCWLDAPCVSVNIS